MYRYGTDVLGREHPYISSHSQSVYYGGPTRGWHQTPATVDGTVEAT